MNKLDPVIQKDKITILITAIVFFISLFILTLIIIPSARYSFWNGYHLLLLEKRENNSDISGIIENAEGFDRVVSKYNTSLEFTNYNTLEKVLLSDIERRFNPEDPRLDPFMKEAGKYFTAFFRGESYDIIYIKTDFSERKTAAVLRNILGKDIKWKLAFKYSLLYRYFVMLLFISVIASLIYVKHIKTYIFFINSIIWLLIIFRYDLNFFYAAIINLVLISYFLEIIDLVSRKWIEDKGIDFSFIMNRKNAGIVISVYISSLVTVYLVSPSVKSSLIFSAVFVTEILVLLLDLMINIRKITEYIHTIFCNVPILDTNKSRLFDKWKKIRPLTFYLILLSVTLPAAFLNNYAEMVLPVPVERGKSVAVKDLNLENIQKLRITGNNNKDGIEYLPDITDYFIHLAYQIKLPYITDYSLPGRDERIIISHYFQNKNNFQKEKKVAYRFTDSWFKDNIIRIRDSGFTGLMLSEKNLIRVVFSSNVPAADQLVFIMLYSFFYIAVIIMVIGHDQIRKTYYENHIIPVLKRRKQQAA